MAGAMGIGITVQVEIAYCVNDHCRLLRGRRIVQVDQRAVFRLTEERKLLFELGGGKTHISKSRSVFFRVCARTSSTGMPRKSASVCATAGRYSGLFLSPW